MGSRIATAANWTIVVTGIVMSVAVGSRYFWTERDAPRLPQYGVGERVIQGNVIDFARVHKTLLAIIDPTCPICTEMMPFMKRLSNAASAGSGTRVVFAGRHPLDALNRYLEEHDIVQVEVVTLPPSSLKIRQVPAIILTDRQGRFIKSWVGKLDEDTQAEVLVSLSARR